MKIGNRLTAGTGCCCYNVLSSSRRRENV